jgi:cysteine-rich repeat protein
MTRLLTTVGAVALSAALFAGCALNVRGQAEPGAQPEAAGGNGSGASAQGGATQSGSQGGAGGADDVIPKLCGDGVLHPDEECDDGNPTPGDGCSAACLVEPAFDCSNVTVLTAGTTVLTGNTSGEPSHDLSNDCNLGAAAADVMHPVQVPISGELTITLEGSFDKLVYVRGGCDSDVELLCHSGTTALTRKLDVSAGATYYVVVDGAGQAAGAYTLTLDLVGCGDGLVNLDEECDDGDSDGTDGCTTTCTVLCPAGWTKDDFGKHCYRMFDENRNWASARDACAALGADYHLATAVDIPEYTFIGSFLGGQGDVWIGGHDRISEGSFEWETNEPWLWTDGASPPWASGEPNNFAGEDCVELDASGAFNDESCGDSQRHLCEFVPPGS